MPVDVPDDSDNDKRNNEVVEFAKEGADGLPIVSEHFPRVDESDGPRNRSQRRVGDELSKRHARDPRGQGNERAHDWQHARKEDRDRSVPREPAVGGCDVVRGDQDVSAIPIEEGPPTNRPDPVGDNRSDQAPKRSSDGCAREGEDVARYHPSGHRQNDLAGQRNARAFDRHTEKHSEITEGSIELLEQRDELHF